MAGHRSAGSCLNTHTPSRSQYNAYSPLTALYSLTPTLALIHQTKQFDRKPACTKHATLLAPETQPVLQTKSRNLSCAFSAPVFSNKQRSPIFIVSFICETLRSLRNFEKNIRLVLKIRFAERNSVSEKEVSIWMAPCG